MITFVLATILMSGQRPCVERKVSLSRAYKEWDVRDIPHEYPPDGVAIPIWLDFVVRDPRTGQLIDARSGETL